MSVLGALERTSEVRPGHALTASLAGSRRRAYRPARRRGRSRQSLRWKRPDRPHNDALLVRARRQTDRSMLYSATPSSRRPTASMPLWIANAVPRRFACFPRLSANRSRRLVVALTICRPYARDEIPRTWSRTIRLDRTSASKATLRCSTTVESRCTTRKSAGPRINRSRTVRFAASQ